MTVISNTAASALHTAQLRVGVAAHNVANMAGGSSERLQVQQQDLPGGGTRSTAVPARSPQPFHTDLLDARQAQHQVEAAVQLLKSEDQMLGSLLDLRA